MWTETSENKSCNFIAPKGLSNTKNEVLFPVPEAQAIDYAASIELVIKQMITHVVVGELTGNCALSADIDDQVTAGAILVITVDADASNRTLSFSSGITGPNVIIEANLTRRVVAIYNGTTFAIINELTSEVLTNEKQTPNSGATLALEINSQETIVEVSEMAAAMTITATIGASVRKGAHLYIKLKSDGTARDVTLSTGFVGTTISGTINKTKYATFVYDGTAFVHIATQQVD